MLLIGYTDQMRQFKPIYKSYVVTPNPEDGYEGYTLASREIGVAVCVIKRIDRLVCAIRLTQEDLLSAGRVEDVWIRKI